MADIKQQIESIDIYNEKLGVTSCQQLLMPPDGLRYIEWGVSDNSLRLFSTETGKQLNVFENMHVGFISAACFPDSRTLVTGGTDNVSVVFSRVRETCYSLLICVARMHLASQKRKDGHRLCLGGMSQGPFVRCHYHCSFKNV